MTVASIVINIAIFIITLVLLVRFLRKDGRWDREKVRKTFRFFTCQSNVLCAFAALLTAVSQLAGTFLICMGIMALQNI